MILKIFCIKLNILNYMYVFLSIKKRSEIAFTLEKCIMDQSCPVVHKSRRPQARLQTAKLFCNNCGATFAEMVLLFLPTPCCVCLAISYSRWLQEKSQTDA
jgi:hypothetical protein